MKIEKVTYQKTYSIGPYLTDRVGFEASIDEDEDTPENALSQLEEIADQWHKYTHPHLYQEGSDPRFTPGYTVGTHTNGPNSQVVAQPIIIDKSIERLEIAIENADTIEKLQKIKEENPVMTVGVNAQWNAKHELLKRYFQC